MSLPSLFVSHGAPTLPLESVPAADFLRSLGSALPGRPKSILAVSAHWETETPTVSAVSGANETIHDFHGFPPALYRMSYPAPGAPSLAERVGRALAAAGLPAAIDRRRGLDHGAWVPLLMMFPEADIPVAQLSIQSHLGPAHHLAVGRALAPLREQEDDVLILASGSFTHNLSAFRGQRPDSPELDWAARFADWFADALTEGRVADLVAYRRLAPEAQRNHPTDEHLLPIFVALGAAGEPQPKARRLHRSTTYGALRMDAFAFGAGSAAVTLDAA
jgi:4,5-DOPA dioxygenase extradiol